MILLSLNKKAIINWRRIAPPINYCFFIGLSPNRHHFFVQMTEKYCRNSINVQIPDFFLAIAREL
ncbi:hypothetical protein H6F42_11585 [Pseudanabaena sp. FACHB-1998]|nr:hypothetical protein [Pseudanabaena sp. FACHB-1998]